MTMLEFTRSLTKPEPPAGLAPALAALWWAGKDNWNRAHTIVMEADGDDCAWVHAYLHRVEGDLPNARYWYQKAGKPVALGALKAEWEAIAAAMLGPETAT
jgi:hypothetical protein